MVTYTYAGLDLYVKVKYPQPAIRLNYIKTNSEPVGDGGDKYTGYDRFGRTVDMRWTTISSNEYRERIQYGFTRQSLRQWRKNDVATGGQDEFYGYDPLQRLRKRDQGTLNSSKTGIDGTPGTEQSFQYDQSGNWKSYLKKVSGSTSLDQSRTHNKDNELIAIDGSTSRLAHDRAGNMTRVPVEDQENLTDSHTLTWDAWQRLVRVENDSGVVAEYAYDGSYRRITKTVGSTTRHYYYSAEWKVLEERLNSASTASRQYVWGERYRDDLVLRDRDTNNSGTLDERLYVVHDYFSPTALVDTGGNVVERYSYDSFGVRQVLGPDFAPRSATQYSWDVGFKAQELDPETGRYNYGYRYYSPGLGRFLSRDPLSENMFYSNYSSGSDLWERLSLFDQSLGNLYAYAGNNAVNRCDYLGLDCSTGQQNDWTWSEFGKGLGEGIVGGLIGGAIIGGIAAFSAPLALAIGIGLGAAALYQWHQSGYKVTARGAGQFIGGFAGGAAGRRLGGAVGGRLVAGVQGVSGALGRATAAIKRFGPRLGPKGVVPGRHNANVTVRDASGRIVHHERVVSGGMTPAQKELGFPISSNATHTEAQAVMNTSIPSGPGYKMTITGQSPPCPSCKNYMQLHYENTGTRVQYQWRENGRTQRWNTGP